MQRHITRMVILAALLLMFGIDAEAQWQRQYEPRNQVRFRLGIFEPAGGSEGWDEVFEGFTGRPSDLQDFIWGMDYHLRTGRNTGIFFGFSYFSGKTTSAYEDWVADDGSEIRHTSTLAPGSDCVPGGLGSPERELTS